jgi:hypothetical protein
MKIVFIVHHSYAAPGGHEEVKLIGVYASKKEAQLAVRRKRRYPGFRDYPKCFQIGQYEVGRDQWSEGFVSN